MCNCFDGGLRKVPALVRAVGLIAFARKLGVDMPFLMARVLTFANVSSYLRVTSQTDLSKCLNSVKSAQFRPLIITLAKPVRAEILSIMTLGSAGRSTK